MSGDRRRGGFTLIELLVVVSILALLIGILMPSLKGARQGAKRAVCGSNLRGIGHAMRAYLNENRDLLPIVEPMPSLPLHDPPWPSIAETLRPYLEKDSAAVAADMAIFHCPADVPGFSDRGEPNKNKTFFESEGSSYTYNWHLYRFMLDPDAPPQSWTLKPTTLYNLVRNPEAIEFYKGQAGEKEIWLLADYRAFHGGKGSTQPFNYLYVDGHVSDLER